MESSKEIEIIRMLFQKKNHKTKYVWKDSYLFTNVWKLKKNTMKRRFMEIRMLHQKKKYQFVSLKAWMIVKVI